MDAISECSYPHSWGVMPYFLLAASFHFSLPYAWQILAIFGRYLEVIGNNLAGKISVNARIDASCLCFGHYLFILH